jgi:hypothetical protein
VCEEAGWKYNEENRKTGTDSLSVPAADVTAMHIRSEIQNAPQNSRGKNRACNPKKTAAALPL